MFCHHCGHEAAGHMAFCPECGHALIPAPVPPSPAPHNTGTRKTLKVLLLILLILSSVGLATVLTVTSVQHANAAHALRAETDQYLDASAAWETAVNGIDTDIQNMEETFSVLEENLQKTEDALADISAKADFVDSVYFTAYPDDETLPVICHSYDCEHLQLPKEYSSEFYFYAETKAFVDPFLEFSAFSSDYMICPDCLDTTSSVQTGTSEDAVTPEPLVDFGISR